jgi:hypothetical protein
LEYQLLPPPTTFLRSAFGATGLQVIHLAYHAHWIQADTPHHL